MKYAHYTKTDADGLQSEGVCHRARLETLATSGSKLRIEMISDEDHAKLVAKWKGVEIAPAVKVEPKKIVKQKADALA